MHRVSYQAWIIMIPTVATLILLMFDPGAENFENTNYYVFIQICMIIYCLCKSIVYVLNWMYASFIVYNHTDWQWNNANNYWYYSYISLHFYTLSIVLASSFILLHILIISNIEHLSYAWSNLCVEFLFVLDLCVCTQLVCTSMDVYVRICSWKIWWIFIARFIHAHTTGVWSWWKC